MKRHRIPPRWRDPKADWLAQFSPARLIRQTFSQRNAKEQCPTRFKDDTRNIVSPTHV
jgi:hypothetical protein